LTIAYARVSSHDQKKDLKTQGDLLATYCIKQGWSYEVIQDLGSGMNYRKKGLKRLLDLIVERKIKRLVLTHKDRLLRFGAELVFSLCELHQIEIVIINQGENLSFEEELAQDVLEIITVFSARMYGARSRKNQRLVEVIKELTK
jgi:predicted site-specific integrase-resolvase